MNADRTYETAFRWAYGGQQPPDYGSIAECYEGRYDLTALVAAGTDIGCDAFYAVDFYIWEDDGGQPGAVLCSLPDQALFFAFYPDYLENQVEIQGCTTPDSWWVGAWGQWVNTVPCIFFAVDLDGPGGCPMTKIAPGQGYPTGWQPAGIVTELAGIRAFGIGARGTPADPVPVVRTSWGEIKSLY